MNAYEEKQEAKRQRLLEAAEAAKRSADQAYDRAQTIGNGIPMGQPILVGHHSESHHRADLKRIETGMRKAIEESKRAEELERRANAVGSGGISSDDPDAVLKLQEKIDGLEKKRDMMKRINKAHARFVKDPQTDLSGFSEAIQEVIRTFVPQYSSEPHPIPPYELTSIGAKIRQAKKRIKRLEVRRATTPKTVMVGEVEFRENVEANRLQIKFPNKPNSDMLAALKRRGFHWAKSQGVWQRQLTNSAVYAAEEIIQMLKGAT